MKTRTPQLFAAAVIAAVAYGCGSSGSTSTNVTTPASTRCEATVSSPASQFSAAGGDGTVTISVARECAWRATSSANWIVFTSGVEGQGDGSVTYRITENTEPVNRQAPIAVAERQVIVAQQGVPCIYSVSGPQQPLNPTGGQANIDVRTHSACSWTALAEQPWVTVAPSSGRGDATVRVTAADNTGPERQTVVVVAGERIAIRQNAFASPPVPVPTPTPPAPVPPGPTPPQPGPTPTPAPPVPTPTPPPPGPTPTPTPPPPGPTPTPTPPGPTPTPPAPTPTPTPPAPTPTPTPPPPTPTPTPTPSTLSGTVESLAGECDAATFRIGSQVVYTTGNTTFSRGPCRSLANGVRIDVTGVVMPDGRVRADVIRFD